MANQQKIIEAMSIQEIHDAFSKYDDDHKTTWFDSLMDCTGWDWSDENIRYIFGHFLDETGANTKGEVA